MAAAQLFSWFSLHHWRIFYVLYVYIHWFHTKISMLHSRMRRKYWQKTGLIGNAIYNSNFTSFAIPGDPNEDETDGQYHCSRYVHTNASSTDLIYWKSYSESCAPEDFSQTISETCHKHVYDDSQYRYPLTAELDLSPCKSSSDYWNLEVSFKIGIPLH